MNLVDLAAVYGIAGAAAAVAVYRAAPGPRRGALVRAAVTLVLWPIWAPLALTSSRAASAHDSEARTRPTAPPDPGVARVEATLDEAVKACAGTPLEALLSPSAAARIAGEMRRAAARHAEVVRALEDASLDLAAVTAKVASLESEGASERALATARLQQGTIRRLIGVRDHDARALAEIADLVSALKAQLWLARVAGTDDAGAGDLVTELWARVEGLSAATPESREVA